MDAQQNRVPQDTEKLKEIPKWTRRYAQNRTLTLHVVSAIGMIIGIVIVGLLSFVIVAFKKGNMHLALVGTVLIAVFVFLYIFSVAKNNLWRWINLLIYGHEGTASIPAPELTKKKKWLSYVVSMVFFLGFMGTMYLGMKNFIPVKYVQPVTALYYVPFTVFFWYFWQRPRRGPLVLICPILYTIHAILIVAGVPIFFTGQSGVIFNMSLPLMVYGFLTQIISHIYSRYALKKLKTAAHLQEHNNG